MGGVGQRDIGGRMAVVRGGQSLLSVPASAKAECGHHKAGLDQDSSHLQRSGPIAGLATKFP